MLDPSWDFMDLVIRDVWSCPWIRSEIPFAAFRGSSHVLFIGQELASQTNRGRILKKTSGGTI